MAVILASALALAAASALALALALALTLVLAVVRERYILTSSSYPDECAESPLLSWSSLWSGFWL
jgi:hypothetical protein